MLLSLVAQNGSCCTMLMPKNNGTATPAACGKNNMAVYPYSASVPEAFQQMTMPMNGHYPVTSKFLQSCIGSPIRELEMWANAQRDGRPAEHRWRPLFNAAKFG